MRLVRFAQRICFITGLGLLVVYLVTYIHGSLAANAAKLTFRAQQQAKLADQNQQNHREKPEAFSWRVDSSLWSPKRLVEYVESLANHGDSASGMLRIDSLHFEAPIFEGTDDSTLNRGVGRIEGTAALGGVGNVGLAAHRDGFFRVLKDIAVGDRLELVTLDATYVYTVDRISLVNPDQVSVLEDRGVPSMTLVTCYPFYFVGDAPQRFIVQSTKQNQP